MHDTADIVTSLPVAQIADIPPSKITSGTFAASMIPVMDASHITGQLLVARFPDMDARSFPSGAPWARVHAAFAGQGWNTIGSYMFAGWDGQRDGMMWQYVAGDGVRGSCIAPSGWINMRSTGSTGSWVNCGEWHVRTGRQITLFHKVA